LLSHLFLMKPVLLLVLALFVTLSLAACGGEDAPDASGDSTDTPAVPVAASPDLPIQQAIDIGPIDAALAAVGEADFTTRCTTCHKMDERYVGPALGDVSARRTPEWIMNMILAPDKMIVSDPDAQALFLEYSIPMTNQNLTEVEARAMLEYLRQVAEPTP